MKDHIGQSGVQRHERLMGNYRILRLLGQGSFADVYLGEHIHLHTQAAIKVLQVRLVESNIQSFLNEARTIAHLVHPYIIRVLDFGVEGDTPFLVMDYAPQGTFRHRFLRGKPLPATPLFPFIKQAASALQYAHDKKLIHRDVKPENMLLGPNEEILLSDFGFAVIQTSLTRPSIETAGTASYMAPEQFQGKPQPASDQYSLGVIAYEWLTGSCPFQGTFLELASQHMMAPPPSLIQRVPGLSAQIAQVVMTALEKEPEQRFPSVRDFARALEHACLSSSNTHLSISSSTMPHPSLASPANSQTNQMSPASPGIWPNPVEPSQSGLWPNSSIPTPGTTSVRLSGLNMSGTAERFSQSGLPPLQPPYMNQHRSELTNTLQFLPVKPPEQSFSSASPPSQSHRSVIPDLLPLPQQPFLMPELAKQESPTAMAPQMFPQPQNTSIRTFAVKRNFPAANVASSPEPDLTTLNQQLSPLLASNVQSTPQPASLVRAEDFRKIGKSSTSGVLPLFIIFMIALIIGSTAILVTVTNNEHNGLKSRSQSTPRINATASQKTTRTPGQTTTEQNPYGNHNGMLVLNNSLTQQDQQMHWDELPGTCSFSTDGYHVVASPQSQGFTVCNATASDYANFVYQAQMTFTKTTSTAASGGLVFRGNQANHQFYFFEIFTTGNYALYRCPGSNGAECPLLSSSTITGGPIASFHANLNQTNTIALFANGYTFSFYVNNQLIVGPIGDSVTDPTYAHGTIGMMARQNNAGAETDVVFSNIKVWKM